MFISEKLSFLSGARFLEQTFDCIVAVNAGSLSHLEPYIYIYIVHIYEESAGTLTVPNHFFISQELGWYVWHTTVWYGKVHPCVHPCALQSSVAQVRVDTRKESQQHRIDLHMFFFREFGFELKTI